MGFSRQEYWSGWNFLLQGNLPNPGIEPESPALQANSTIWATGEDSKVKIKKIKIQWIPFIEIKKPSKTTLDIFPLAQMYLEKVKNMDQKETLLT